MPGLDGTGPLGLGPMTGGGRGWCNPYSPLYWAGPYGAYAASAWVRPVAPVVSYQPYVPWGWGAVAPFAALGFGLWPRVPYLGLGWFGRRAAWPWGWGAWGGRGIGRGWRAWW